MPLHPFVTIPLSSSLAPLAVPTAATATLCGAIASSRGPVNCAGAYTHGRIHQPSNQPTHHGTRYEFDENWIGVKGSSPLWRAKLPVVHSASHRITVVHGLNRRSLLVTGALTLLPHRHSAFLLQLSLPRPLLLPLHFYPIKVCPVMRAMRWCPTDPAAICRHCPWLSSSRPLPPLRSYPSTTLVLP